MSQNPLIDSRTQSSKTLGLKPALASALASLEVQLDQELTRYRRTRNSLKTSRPFAGGSYINSPPQRTFSKNQSTAAAVKADVKFPGNSTAIHPDEPEPVPVSSGVEPVRKPIPPSPAKLSSSIVPTKAKTPERENVLQPDESPNQPDDYLESSEALLRSLTEEEAQTTQSSTTSESLLSPLGIGSMLLLLLASLTLGYVVFNPKSLPQWNLGTFLPKTATTASTENNAVVSNNSQLPDAPPSTPIPKYPNLASNEFPVVRDPNDVVSLKPKFPPTPSAVTKSVPIPQPINPVVPLNPPPAITAKPVVTPTAIATPVKLSDEIKPAADGFYHVITDNLSASTLATARKVVPDAYLSRNQKFIYLGALKNKEQVKLRLQQLQEQGIIARVEQP
jgi:hypothetical protein